MDSNKNRLVLAFSFPLNATKENCPLLPCLNAHFNGFKLATSTYVLSILDVCHLSHIPQALRFHCYDSEVFVQVKISETKESFRNENNDLFT